MSFSDEFTKYFTTEQQKSSMFQIWNLIGQNMEKAILEEQTRLTNQMIDINTFSEDTLRSWLSFFLRKIPYRTTSIVPVELSTDGDSVVVPTHSRVLCSNNKVFSTTQEYTINKNAPLRVNLVQGSFVTETGTLNSINTTIKFQASNPDLDFLTVKINDDVIPEVSFNTSYDQLHYLGSWNSNDNKPELKNNSDDFTNSVAKGSWYNCIGDKTINFGDRDVTFKNGDVVVYDGNKWCNLTGELAINPINFNSTYAIPSGGYFAYYFENNLYIKVFTNKYNIGNINYSIEYLTSDGTQGESDSTDTFEFMSKFTDTNDNNKNVSVLIRPLSASTIASNEPDVGKLGLLLKESLYCGISLSTIPEYTAWFKAQPEVGDCLVLGDYERAKLTGVSEATGVIEVLITDPVGNTVDPTSEQGIALITKLNERIEPYKDIGYITYTSYEDTEFKLKFYYTSASDEEIFKTYIKSISQKFFELSYTRAHGDSLFQPLDVAELIDRITDGFNGTCKGLYCKPFYHTKYDVVANEQINIECYSEAVHGEGYYELYDGDGNILDTLFETTTSDANTSIIYNKSGTQVGIVANNVVSIKLTQGGTLHCYWLPKNEGYVKLASSYRSKRALMPRINGEDVSVTIEKM